MDATILEIQLAGFSQIPKPATVTHDGPVELLGVKEIGKINRQLEMTCSSKDASTAYGALEWNREFNVHFALIGFANQRSAAERDC